MSSDSRPTLHLTLRGTHISLDTVKNLFPHGIAQRSAISSRVLDPVSLKSRPQSRHDQWRNLPGDFWKPFSDKAIESDTDEDHTGYDDVQHLDLAFERLDGLDTDADVWALVSQSIQTYLHLPAVHSTFPVFRPDDLFLPAEPTSHLPAPILLGIRDSKDCRPADWLDLVNPTTLVRCLIHRLGFSNPTRIRTGFSVRLVRTCLDGSDNFGVDEEWLGSPLSSECHMFVGWADRSRELACADYQANVVRPVAR